MRKLISIIIPIKNQVKKRVFPGYCEVIYVDKYKKTEARNWGSKIAKTKYLMHIDSDNEINDEIFEKIKKIILTKKPDQITLEEFIDKPINIWQKARSLERKILAGNKILSTSQIITKKLFNRIGGYDERFNELDDWALWMRLASVHHSPIVIHHATTVFEPTNTFQILRRRFKKGTELKYFREVYGGIPQTDVKRILNFYLYRYQLITKNSFIFICLLILKFFDYLGLFLGNIFPVRPNIDKLYQDKLIAQKFNDYQESLYGKIKDYLEKRALLHQIPTHHDAVYSKFQILDLGAGTGRLTKFLFEKGYKVTPADISRAMIDQFLQQSWISVYKTKPVLIKGNKLPFKNNSFETVFSMRVIWHIKSNIDRNTFFSEAVRVAKKNIIMDFSFFGNRSDYQFGWDEIKTLAKKNKLKIMKSYYLPLGRLLINFSKKSH